MHLGVELVDVFPVGCCGFVPKQVAQPCETRYYIVVTTPHGNPKRDIPSNVFVCEMTARQHGHRKRAKCGNVLDNSLEHVLMSTLMGLTPHATLVLSRPHRTWTSFNVASMHRGCACWIFLFARVSRTHTSPHTYAHTVGTCERPRGQHWALLQPWRTCVHVADPSRKTGNQTGQVSGSVCL